MGSEQVAKSTGSETDFLHLLIHCYFSVSVSDVMWGEGTGGGPRKGMCITKVSSSPHRINLHLKLTCIVLNSNGFHDKFQLPWFQNYL